MSRTLRKDLTRLATVARRSRVFQISAMVAVLCLVALHVISARSARLEGATPPAATSTLPPGPTPQLPGTIQQPTQPGLLQLDDFQIVIPKGWQRRSDWEDQGPGTKLFLLGPKVAQVQLVIGIDVYPLRDGTTLEQFAKQYKAQWNPVFISDKPARLCEQPARMVGLTENSLDKLYLLCVCKNRGYSIGMIGPTGQSAQSALYFRQLVDTFQLYE